MAVLRVLQAKNKRQEGGTGALGGRGGHAKILSPNSNVRDFGIGVTRDTRC